MIERCLVSHLLTTCANHFWWITYAVEKHSNGCRDLCAQAALESGGNFGKLSAQQTPSLLRCFLFVRAAVLHFYSSTAADTAVVRSVFGVVGVEGTDGLSRS